MSESRCVMLVRPSEVMAKDEDRPVKKEIEVCVKKELVECCVCASRALDCTELKQTRTASGTSLPRYLSRYTRADLASSDDPTRLICQTCINLINVLEQAELEYLKLREAFEAVINKNPIFFPQVSEAILPVKLEYNTDVYDEPPSHHDDSEDEPLAVTKKKRRRKVVKSSKKKVCAPTKRKTRAKKDSSNDKTVEPESATDQVIPVLRDVKKEDSVDGSETSQLNNGLELFKVEVDFDDDDDDSNFMPDELSNEEEEAERKKTRREKTVKKKQAIHQCDQCDAKYTTFKRLEIHKEKHSEGKPPFICEVCGAHYKHKRACDIHVALHKGISDWKCEECNKLFPSKGALQRHNNIHTGKLNYQCDLCGKSFIHTSSFKMHKLSHSGVKPHACDVCGLALMTRSHLKRHKRVHSGEKRHECNICGKRFSERYNLVAHTKSHEGVAELPPQPRRRLFRCPYCQERFERRYMLERHVSVSHGRTLERSPATPRNTMSKLLKAQAAARTGAGTGPDPGPGGHLAGNTNSPDHLTDTKEERSPDSRASSIVPAKQLQLVSAVTTITAGSWSGAYAAEFGLRPDYPH